MWWIVGYFAVGSLTLLAMKYLPPRMEFVEGTQGLSIAFVLLLWPVFWIVMMFTSVEMP